MEFPIEFEMPHIPKKVYNRYRRYAGWLHKPKDTAGRAVMLLLWMGLFVYFTVKRDDPLLCLIYGFYALVYIAVLFAVMLRQQTLWGGPSLRWHYLVTETYIEAVTRAGVRQTWEYSALAYIHEAKDAFYFVTDDKDGRAMIVPKETLAPEQCAALSEVLGRCVPENKFTRTKARRG